MSKTEISAPAGSHEITINREFDAPRDLVFRAFTDPTLLPKWLGPRRLTMTVDRHEVQHGGVWRYIHRDEHGNEGSFRGVFHGTPSPDLTMRTFEFEGFPGHVSFETLRLEEQNGRTLMRQTAVFQSVADRDGMLQSGMESGVNDSMERLTELLAQMTVRA